MSDEQDEERLYDCPDCLDSGYLPASPKKFPRVSGTGKGYVTGMGVWFCSCARAERMQAGYWFRVVYPEDARGRHRDPQGESRLLDYLNANPGKRKWLDSAIEGLRKQYEAERKRATEARES